VISDTLRHSALLLHGDAVCFGFREKKKKTSHKGHKGTKKILMPFEPSDRRSAVVSSQYRLEETFPEISALKIFPIFTTNQHEQRLNYLIKGLSTLPGNGSIEKRHNALSAGKLR